jgi:hypothetical protein
MVMQEQARRLNEPLRWGRRERTIIGIVLAIVVATTIALVAYGASSGAPARADCVEVTFPSTLGGAVAKGCGPRARQICASGAFKGVNDDVRTACAHAGFPFRPAPE